MVKTMRRYLSLQEVTTLLNLGKTAEIFMGRRPDDPEVLHYVQCRKNREQSYELCYYQCLDQGDAEHLDIYAFSPADPDEDPEVHTFSSMEAMATYLQARFLVAEMKFVNEGMIQDEYRVMLLDERSSKD